MYAGPVEVNTDRGTGDSEVNVKSIGKTGWREFINLEAPCAIK